MSVDNIKATTVSDAAGTTYAQFGTNQLELYAGTLRGLTINTAGGILHGAWQSDATVTTSDRRLKRNIEPLYRTLSEHARNRWNEGPAKKQDGGEATTSDAATEASAQFAKKRDAIPWLLRELRPVSYHLKTGPEAKYLKFGFVAQELESVLPNLVRTSEQDDTKSVASQDLIAVLTLAMQMLQRQNEEHRRELLEQSERIARLEAAVYGAAQI